MRLTPLVHSCEQCDHPVEDHLITFLGARCGSCPDAEAQHSLIEIVETPEPRRGFLRPLDS